MDKPRRLTRGRPSNAVRETAVPSKRVKTSIPVATNMSTAGGRRGTAAADLSAPSKKVSPSRLRVPSPSRRTRTSPVRRSSRPRSTIPTVTVIPMTVAPRSKETKEESETNVSQINLPATLTTNTSSKAPNRATTTSTSSIQSSYSSSTTVQTIEVRTTGGEPSDITKLTDYIRRSVSKTFSLGGGGRGTETREGSYTPSQRTDGESRYSRSVSRSVYGDGDGRYSKAEFSDDEGNDREGVIHEEDDADLIQEEEHFRSFNANSATQASSLCRKMPIPTEFGGWLGVLLLMIAIPCTAYYLQWCCSARKCEFKVPDYKAILDTNSWIPQTFDIEAVGVYLAFNLGIFMLSAVLFGRGVRLPGSAEYKFNALPMTVLLTAAYATATYFEYPVADFIIKNYQRLGVYSFLNAYVLALWAYFRSDVLKQRDSQCNIYAKSGNFLVDYALGRQLNPKWLGFVDFKLVFYRVSLISAYLHVVALLYKNIQTPWVPKEIGGGLEMASYFLKHTKYDTTSLLCGALVLLYILDAIVFEHHLASSFELQGEGFGCLLLLRYAATPLLLTSVAKYFSENRTPLQCKFAIYIPVVLLLGGLALKRFSNAIKYKYRVQPNHPHFRDIETIHTFQGRRLLLGSVWGRLRQPNYLGDIICLIAMALPLALRFVWPPLISLLLIVALLVHRCLRVNARNSARYHSSWVRYRSIARNYLIPKIF